VNRHISIISLVLATLTIHLAIFSDNLRDLSLLLSSNGFEKLAVPLAALAALGLTVITLYRVMHQERVTVDAYHRQFSAIRVHSSVSGKVRKSESRLDADRER
jgi:hypothetical protein